jgi:4-hydroxy-3-methylbut-2-enyl diphosphate reductase
VKYSVEHLNAIITKHHGKHIYLLGDLVHNREIMKRFLGLGVHVVYDLKSIKDKNAIIVFPAHGVTHSNLSYAKAHFKYVYDLTCKILLSNYKIVKQLSKKYDVLYYGHREHPESKAILSLANNTYLLDKSTKIRNDKKYVLVNQSTIPSIAVRASFNKLKFPHPIKYIPTTCNATDSRHKVVSHLKNIDCLIVCGNEKSNNTIELVKLSQSNRVPAILISSEIDAHQFKPQKNKRYAIISGTSVQPLFFDKIYKILKNKK